MSEETPLIKDQKGNAAAGCAWQNYRVAMSDGLGFSLPQNLRGGGTRPRTGSGGCTHGYSDGFEKNQPENSVAEKNAGPGRGCGVGFADSLENISPEILRHRQRRLL